MVKRENGYIIWDKSDKEHISKWFTTTEFNCKCEHDTCKEQKISEELINRLEWLREASKSPVRIHSGFRCEKKQEDIRKSGTSTVVAKKSQHELGNAADVSVSALTIPHLMKLAEMKFKSIGIALNFLHLDTRDDKVRRWNY